MPTLAKQFENVFPELTGQLEFVTKVVKEEEEGFLRTLEKGLKRIDDIVKTIRNTKRIELEDCGHLIPIEKPQEFAGYINKFVKNLT